MIKKKYELTDETIEIRGKTLHRIRALRDFSDVEKGDLGGYIEREGNLSHEDSCWVYYNAKVYGNALSFFIMPRYLMAPVLVKMLQFILMHKFTVVLLFSVMHKFMVRHMFLVMLLFATNLMFTVMQKFTMTHAFMVTQQFLGMHE
ncbi:hypothetical protein [Bartonella jaculi]|uniref:Uncharacterized protein n=1 Tax=Bartonella jaculi TaxID=686226 RepID=A0ABP9N8U0_9HYPH